MATYLLDAAHSSVGFSVKHMMIAKVRGTFDQVIGKLEYDPTNQSNSFAEATIQSTSINTNQNQRDEHLRSADFFDVQNFPTLSFKSHKVIGSGSDLRVVGELTIKGLTKDIELRVDGPSGELKDPFGNIKIGLSATAKINRKDFGLTWNAALETVGVLVGEEVTINLDLQFAKQV
jgi:polyisoprenoid-binding protein YceI